MGSNIESISRNGNPEVGMVATVRNRRGVISSLHPCDGPTGRLHLVELEYNDGEYPFQETLIWEKEAEKNLISPAALPRADVDDPMNPDDLTALVRACRWTGRIPYMDFYEGSPLKRLPITSPFHGAVQIDDYQLVPLLKALRMPRVSLLIADDVGLGKTVEAGLILKELLLRRSIRRILIAAPASLRTQWQEEMRDKFSLPFTIVDRESTMKMRRELGMDANPWRTNSRIITSYHYLKQPDVLEQFRAAQETESSNAMLPWDLLIVDEVQGLTPSPFGDDSELCQMLRQIAPMFEHRVFLTATPHNGHTRSFTGLLELLDPVRFSQKDEMSETDKKRAQDVLIRRLKREINARTSPPRFSDRQPPQALLIDPGPAEQRLVDAFNDFRTGLRKMIGRKDRRKRLAGNFAIEILGKRLLSCPVCFSDSWQRCRNGMAEENEEVSDNEITAVKRTVDEETGDDREAESRTRAASATVGSWMRPFVDDLSSEIREINSALESLGIFGDEEPPASLNPRRDSRFEKVWEWIERNLLTDDDWADNERLIIFTEYKTTLDYLLRRFRERKPDDEQRFLSLYGGMDENEREAVKAAFNDPEHPVRILLGTDAASEGLNLQLTARYVLHYDVPWNPARLEQRNGRLDRHGQARNVQTFHFVSANDQDLRFLDMVIKKVHNIREDLGTTGDVFDEIIHRRLVDGVPLEQVRKELEAGVDAHDQKDAVPGDKAASPEEDNSVNRDNELSFNLQQVASEIDFNPENLRRTLDAAMKISGGRSCVSAPDEEGRCEISPPSTWNSLVDETLRISASGAVRGRLPRLTFNPDNFVKMIASRPVFRPRKDTALMHLSHPLMQRALSDLTRQRFPGGSERPASRWTVFRGKVPGNADALLRITLEELAINNLRETFHHWVRTIVFPVQSGQLGDPLPHTPAAQIDKSEELATDLVSTARELWEDVERELKKWLKEYNHKLSSTLMQQMKKDQISAHENENARFTSRQGEISALIETITVSSKRKHLQDLQEQRRQWLFQDETLDRIVSDIEKLQEEVRRSERHYEELREQLKKERERIINHLIPNRYAIHGKPQVMPVAIEIIYPRSDK